jgi:leucyl aminopeptidase
MRAGMGDVYAGVFGPDEAWRDTVVAAGTASGDLAWPWPLHPRYWPLIDSTVADLRNVAGRSFGFPALLDEDRGDAFGRGASGYGVRMLVELAAQLSVTLSG